MTRRQVISRFGLWSALAIYGNLSFLKLGSVHKVVVFNTLTSDSDQAFNDPNEFWRKGHDPYSEALNAEFIATGRLLKVKSVLSPDKHAVVLMKYYRSEDDHLEYVRLLAERHQKATFDRKIASVAYREPTLA
jgi:hypothetical protein